MNWTATALAFFEAQRQAEMTRIFRGVGTLPGLDTLLPPDVRLLVTALHNHLKAAVGCALPWSAGFTALLRAMGTRCHWPLAALEHVEGQAEPAAAAVHAGLPQADVAPAPQAQLHAAQADDGVVPGGVAAPEAPAPPEPAAQRLLSEDAVAQAIAADTGARTCSIARPTMHA